VFVQHAHRLAVIALLLSGCGNAAAPTVTPSQAASTTVVTASAAPAASASSAPSIKPSLSPAIVKPGKPWLLFAWHPDVLYLVRPDGSDRQELHINAPGVKFAPTWAPGGNAIAFVMRGPKSATPAGSIWTANVDGSDRRTDRRWR
jgi:hypothetical protein